jgi:two-component system sensor histidine kinase UhpB
MSLRLRIHLLVTALMAVMVIGLGWREIDGTRRSVREEIEAASRVAIQVLGVIEQRPFDEALLMLSGMGRVRANRLTLINGRGEKVYTSPESLYKPGRNAPAWFASLVTPETSLRHIALPEGRIELMADPSRAVLDGWDDFSSLVAYAGFGTLALSALIAMVLHRHLGPLTRIEKGLRSLQQGHFATRLPPLQGREAALISQAFNDMAQAVQDNLLARDDALKAQASLAQSRELNQIILDRLEVERGRIARELHDNLGQQLTAVNILSEVLLKDPSISEDKADVARLLKRACADMTDSLHRMLPRLRPLALDKLSLSDALHDLLIDWRQISPEVRYELQIDPDLPDLGEAPSIALYRITQEALTNAAKHAQATLISVTLQRHPAMLSLRVVDNGRGLQPGWQAAGHYGLIGIEERARALGGHVQLDVGPDGRRGMSLQVNLPWSPKPSNNASTLA